MKKLLLLAALLSVGMATAQKNTEMKLISYNIRGTGHADDVDELDWEVRKSASITMIERESPDVIGFQEPKNEQVEYLVEQLKGKYDHVVAGRDQGVSPTGEHLLVMWKHDKYDLLKWGHYWLSETPHEVSRGWDAKNRRVTVWVWLKDKATGKKFFYFNTHLDHKGQEARRLGILLNVRKMRQLAGKKTPVFISGDMNCEKGHKTWAYLDGYRAWMDSAHDVAKESDDRPSFNGFGTKRIRTLDYIFFRNAEAVRYETLDGADYGVKYISDHYPIACTFNL